MEVQIPRSVPISTVSSSPVATMSARPSSPYSMAGLGPSSSSLTSFVSSVSSDGASLRYELERLQIRWRESQENLRLARETAEQQQDLFERELAAREARHRQELEEARRGYMSSRAAGKRRKE
jgi:hypothetical protein